MGKDHANDSSDEDSQQSETEEQDEQPIEPANEEVDDDSTTFKDLGVVDVLCEACEELKWKKPSKIQKESIPVALQGKDIIGLAETGSGKTGAFALPILQALLENPQRYFALILTPTRELAFQISEQFEALGASIGVKCAVIVGGMDMVAQALTLSKKPHIIIATPGRLVDHLENTKGFNLKALKFLVMDEADRILNMDFEVEVDKILRVIPRERRTYLFSATMTKKVQKLQRASLQDPVKVEVSTKYQTVEKLLQYYLFIPVKYKDVYLVHIMNEMAGNSFIVFVATCAGALRAALLLRNLGLAAVPLHGQMSQNKRLAALNKFKNKSRSILICTDVASRGLDIPHVDVVINLDIPLHSKDYIHRVGRTARAGRSGKSITFVSQYDVELYQRIEQLIGKQLPLYKTEESEVMVLQERVAEAQRLTKIVMDEADRILNMDFEVEVDKILRVIPRERRTYLFSATMTKKVQKLQRASLQDPVKVEVSTKYQTVEKLLQYYLFIPVKYKDVYLVHIMNEMAGNSFIVFVATCAGALRAALLLRNLGLAAVPLHGQMSQNKRLAALNKFKNKSRSILICTDVASRGLDIPHVDVVINLDIPLHSKDYIHRVGRTARAGRSGKSITFVSQYDVELYQRIEQLIGKQLPLYKTEESEVMVLQERVAEAQRLTKIVMDEADRILNMDFEVEVDKILRVIPRERRTYLFSATMTKKVQKLQRASLQDPVKVEVSTKYQTVEKLLQYYLFIPVKYKDVYLVHIMNEMAGNSFIVFVATCAGALRAALLLRNLGLAAVPLHGQMSQNKRLAALNKFKNKSRSILICTDVASRGLDIPHVDVVINLDIPLHSKDYIHRVGRTARAGRSGKSITFVSQYDVELYQRIEQLIGKQLPLYKTEESEVMVLQERVAEAQRLTKIVMDEADRILNMDFEVEVDKILRVIPRERRTYLFSATMTKKVQKLQRASLQDPVKVEVSTKYQTVEKLLQYYLFIPVKYKDVYLVHIMNEMAGNSFIVFVATCAGALRAALLLRNLGLAAVPLHGQMSQNKRLAALNKFKNKSRSILICTDVASRGLDIPHVDVVINLDIPLHSKDYIHRVGRTARAGRSGKSITFVSQYDVELYQRIEQLIGKQLPLYKTEESEVMVLQERVAEAQRLTKIEMKELEDKRTTKGKKRGADSDDDTEEAAGVRRRLKGGKGKNNKYGGKRKKR